MGKSLIYYTDNRLGEPVFSAVQKQLLRTNLPIVSVSLRPIDFGENHIIHADPSPYTMMCQILLALEYSKGDQIFFCEHDVLYPLSHFEFTIPSDSLYYYNENVWRWDYPKDRFISYDRLISLSSLCCDRKLAIDHYRARVEKVEVNKWYEDKGRDPEWARIMGFEPGTKKRKRGGFSDDDFETWKSREPIIDVRHDKTYSKRKVDLGSFKHQPENWKEATFKEIGGEDYGIITFDTSKK